MNTVGEHPYFSLVLPSTYDAGNVEMYVANVCEILENRAAGRYEMIMICGQDESFTAVANTLTPIYEQLRIVEAPGPAVARGWEVAHGDVLGVLDGQLTEKPTSLIQIIDTIEEGADMAIASQYDTEHKLQTDAVLGCFAIRKNCLSRLKESPQGQQMLRDILGEENMQQIENHFSKNPGSLQKWQTLGETVGHLLHLK